MRLIDADAANVEDILCYYGDNCRTEDVKEWLDEQPTIDAVPVVRCKDCEFSNDLICPGHSHDALEDGFCTEGRHNDG